MGGKAYVGLKPTPHYRRDAFERGLMAHGYRLVGDPHVLGHGDVAVFWNLYAYDTELTAEKIRGRGGLVIVAENGYAGTDEEGRQLYAMALDGHNGSGRWLVGDSDRLLRFGIEPKPWRVRLEGPLLVCGQRGIGSAAMASPPAWHLEVGKAMEARGVLHVLRHHPGQDEATRATLDAAICASRGVVIWSSGCGVRALLLGTPVWFAAPHWVCELAARKLSDDPDCERPLMDDALRQKALHAMSWAQWSVGEIANGDAFDALFARAKMDGGDVWHGSCA